MKAYEFLATVTQEGNLELPKETSLILAGYSDADSIYGVIPI